jgi:hypothetical protein
MKHLSAHKPDFLIVGAMKCATSTLHDQLDSHASFFMTTPKEPNFFSDDGVYAKGIEWYESLFAGASDSQLKGESSTHYTKLPSHPKTIERLAAYCPDVKCIYVMRHPVDRLISHYIHEWTQGVISCDIDSAVERFPELVDYGKYNMQIEPYLDTFGSSSILPLFAERFRDNPQRELQTVFDFLEITERPVWKKDVRSNVSSERLRVCGWRDVLVNNSLLTVVRRTLVPKTMRRKIRQLWTMKERPHLSQQTFAHVQNIFNEDLQELGQKLAMKLDCSAFKQQIIIPDRIEWDYKTMIL